MECYASSSRWMFLSLADRLALTNTGLFHLKWSDNEIERMLSGWRRIWILTLFVYDLFGGENRANHLKNPRK